MNKNEFDLIRAGIKSAYPAHNIMPDVPSIRFWYRMLGDLDYKVCEAAVLELAATHKFPPSIAEIREKYAEYIMDEIEDEGGAWGLVLKAIQNYGYYRADEAIASLPDGVRDAVKRIGFKEICEDENVAATRAHFMKIYSSIATRARNERAITPELLQQKQLYQSLFPVRDVPKIESTDSPVLEDHERASPEFIDQLLKDHGLRGK